MFNGEVINNLPIEQIVKLGLTLIPEGRLLFPGLRTSDNLELGAYHRRGKEKKEEIKHTYNNVVKLFPVIKERERQIAGTLSGGEQQMLAIGRGLMSRPQLLLLDEPSLGLAPILVGEVMSTLDRLRREQGITILIAEQNVEAVLSIADRGYVLDTGTITMEGSRKELRSTDAVRAAYLGR